MKMEKEILISFIGSNDAGKFKAMNDGAILTALTNQKFDEVILLWNQSSRKEIDFSAISIYLKKEILKRKLAKKVTLVEQKIKDITDHNEIYLCLKEFTDLLIKTEDRKYTAAISSGTPAMQVCWILLAESGDFSDLYPLNLIKVSDPKFGKTGNVPVKIDTSLPRIVRLKEEVESLKDGYLPVVNMDLQRATVFIGDEFVDFAPIEFCYYRYFLELIVEEKSPEKISALETSLHFVEKIYHYHEESFPVLDLARDELRKNIKDKRGIAIATFRGNVSKVNKKIKSTLNDENISKYYEIDSTGKRGAKFYGIKLPSKKIEIK